MTGAQLAEALEAASQGLPYTEETADAMMGEVVHTVPAAHGFACLSIQISQIF